MQRENLVVSTQSQDAGQTHASITDLADRLTKLLALERVGNRLVESALSKTDHLGGDSDATLVQDLDSIPTKE